MNDKVFGVSYTRNDILFGNLHSSEDGLNKFAIFEYIGTIQENKRIIFEVQKTKNILPKFFDQYSIQYFEVDEEDEFYDDKIYNGKENELLIGIFNEYKYIDVSVFEYKDGVFILKEILFSANKWKGSVFNNPGPNILGDNFNYKESLNFIIENILLNNKYFFNNIHFTNFHMDSEIKKYIKDKIETIIYFK